MQDYQKINPSLLLPSLVVILCGWAGLASGQGLEDRRLDSKLNARSIPSVGERAPSTPSGLDLSVTTSIAYDDNIFQSLRDKRASLVVEVEPSVGWSAGNREATWVRLAYTGTGVLYLSERDGNRIDHRLEAEGAVKYDSVTIAYSANFARLGSPSADVGGQSDRNEYGARVAAIYKPKGKMAYEVSLDRSVVDLVERGFFDFYQSGIGVAASYRYSPKTQVQANYRYGKVEVDRSGEQTFHQIGGELEWRPRRKLGLSLQGGLEYRNYASGSGTEPYLSARMNWNPRPKTSVFGELYRRQKASAAVEGENFNLTGFRVGVNQILRDGWSVNVEAGRETTDYFAVTDEPESGREDTIVYFRPSVSYAFAEDSVIAFLYQYSKNDSNDSEFGYDNHQLGVSLSHQF